MTTTIHPGLTALLCLPAQGEGAFTWPDADNPELLATPAGLELALDRGTDETERQGRRAAVLLGEAGAGKSHVLNSLAAAASNSFGLPAIAVDLSSSREPIGLLDDLVGDGVVPSLFLLDNLDAIENPDLRRRFCQALEDAVEREEGSRWLIASRLATWEHGIHLLRRGLEFHLRPLDDGAMHAAAARYFEQLGAAHQTQAFLDALTAPAFRLRAAAWLARNPRRLQVLTLAWARELTLPTDPEGFEQLVEALQPELGFDDRELAGTREWRELGDDAVCDADLSSQCHIETRSRVRLRSLGPGRFTMGSPDSEEGRWADEGPVRDVDVAAFELGVHPVTNSEYERFVVADPEAELPAYWGDPRFNKDHQPVVGVSWAQAHAFAAWADARLPTEAEWEFAARAGSDASRPCPFDEGAWWTGNSRGRLRSVATRAPNQWGLYDLVGNVWEFVEDDRHDSYEGAPSDARAWVDTPRGAVRLLRGGTWADNPRTVRSTTRLTQHPGPRVGNVGFRIARNK